MHKLRSRGFTLIELLVVIAIIGILSAVVLASLNTARTKGQIAAVQSDLDGVRTQAEIEYTSLGNTYNNTAVKVSAACTTLTGATASGTIFESPTIQSAIQNAYTDAGKQDGTCNIADIGNAYAIAFPLPATPSASSTAWCIDNTGVSRDVDGSNTPYTGVASGATPALGALDDATSCQ